MFSRFSFVGIVLALLALSACASSSRVDWSPEQTEARTAHFREMSLPVLSDLADQLLVRIEDDYLMGGRNGAGYAFYVLGQRLHERDDGGDREKAISLLWVASLPRTSQPYVVPMTYINGNVVTSRYVENFQGLPEAQYLLSTIFREDAEMQSQASYFLRMAARRGYQPALIELPDFEEEEGS